MTEHSAWCRYCRETFWAETEDAACEVKNRHEREECDQAPWEIRQARE